MSIKIPVSADFDGSDVEKSLARLNDQMNRLAQTVAGANKVKFSPVDRGTLAELKAIEARFEELKKVSGGLRDRIKATGQIGMNYSALNWERMYEDPVMRQRKMQQAYQHVTAGSPYAVQPGAGPVPSGARPGAPPAPAPPHQPGQGLSNVIGGIAGAGLRATGPVGGVAANALSSGMSGGMGAGIMGLFGGLAALAVGKGVGAIKDKVDSAGQEGIGYDTLKRTLGDVNVSFNVLRASLRAASNNIDVTFEESQKLGTDFAKLSGISKEQYNTLADEVSVGGGFGRSMGMDPAQSSQFFAQMRGFKVTENTNDSRKLALMIGEAVGKSGSFARADEMLQVIANFTANQSRSGLAGANAVGYSGMLSGLVGSGVAGLDPQGAAALLSRVNSSIAGGGGAGEAGQNFLFSILGKRNGLDPVQAAMLQQQGAFGTGRQAFGAGSLYSKFSSKFGGSAGGAGTSDETNLTAILSATQKQYSSNPSMMLNATARLLGVNENQAMALHTIDPQQLGGMTGRMGRLGLDIGKLSSTGISALSNIESGGPATLRAQADALRNGKKPLSDDERRRLDGALAGGDNEKLKDILTELSYTREQESTEGSKTRESIQGVEKRIQELATHLVTPMNTMRDALILMAGGGKLGATGIAIGAAEADAREKVDNLKSRFEGDAKDQQSIIDDNGLKAQERLKAESRLKERNMLDPKEAEAERERRNKEVAAMQERAKQAEDRLGELRQELRNQTKAVEADRDNKIGTIRAANTPATASKVGAGATPELLAKLSAADKELGLTPGTSAAVFQTESRFNGNAVSRAGARGYAQIMPKTQAALERRHGRTFDPSNSDDSVFMYSAVMKENMGKFGNQDDALRAYNGGWNTAGWGNPETAGYVPKVNANRGSFQKTASPKPIDIPYEADWAKKGMFATPMPEGALSRQPDTYPKVMFEGNFTLAGPNGARAAEPITIKKVVGAPRASGAQQ